MKISQTFIMCLILLLISAPIVFATNENKLEKTIFAGNWCKWTGTGWDFVNTTPINNSASLDGQLEVTVS